MQPTLKKILRALSLDLRHILEGSYDVAGVFHPGDLETRLNELGVWRERPARPLAELPHLSAEDRAARQVIDAYIAYRAETGVERGAAVAEFVREAAYNWANRLLALRCMEARGIIDEVVLQKAVYGGRSLAHNRLARRDPAACAGPDEGLFAVLLAEFAQRAQELPELFAPTSPAIALRPSLPALKRCIALLSGSLRAANQEAAGDDVFSAPDALGWAYQYWNSEEKDRVFEKVRTHKGAKIEGADIIPATQLYTEPYMVKFLVQNSLGALWMGLHPDSKLAEGWEYYVKDADRSPVEPKPLNEITLLDPACGSGHFLLEAFDLFFQVYQEEDGARAAEEVVADILNHNLYGIDIDERAVQIAAAALWMKAKEVAPDLRPAGLTSFHHHLVATNIRLPKGKDHLKAFLAKHPESAPLQPALEAIFEGLENVHELGSLVQIEEPVEKELRYLQEKYERAMKRGIQGNLFEPMAVQGELPLGVESYETWKASTLSQLEDHFDKESEVTGSIQSFFGQSAHKGLEVFQVLSSRYDVVTANPPYMGSGNFGKFLKAYISKHYTNEKKDLYSAFIVRCLQLTKLRGLVSMVTQQSWMFLRSFKDLRFNEKLTSETKGPKEQWKGLLVEKSIEVLIDLGNGAFTEVGGQVVNVVLFVIRNSLPTLNRSFVAYRLNSFQEKGEALIKCIHSTHSKQKYEPKQMLFTRIPQSPICYWLNNRFLELLQKDTIGDVATVTRQVITSNNGRFIRGVWEVPSLGDRWVGYVKGGGYARWAGFQEWALDWEDGIRLKNSIIEKFPYLKGNWGWLIKLDTIGKPGWTFSRMIQNGLAARKISNELCDNSSPVVIPSLLNIPFGVLLNSRTTTYLIRSLSTSLTPNESYISRLPILSNFPGVLTRIEELAVNLKKEITSSKVTEKTFTLNSLQFSGLSEYILHTQIKNLKFFATLHTFEGIAETLIFKEFQLDENELIDIFSEIGFPAMWYSLSKNHENQLKEVLDLIPDANLHQGFDGLKCIDISENQWLQYETKLRMLFEMGTSSSTDISSDDVDCIDTEVDNEEENYAPGLPLPPDSFLEELSLKINLHPFSTYQILLEGISKYGWHCPPEEKRITEDVFTILVLRLLGHRWPKQIEADESIPAWADPDGIIPLTPGLKDPPLLERVRARLPEQFPGGNATAIAHEFAEIMGESLEKWLSSSFFKHHISQFKKRPIAWQLTSQPARGGKGKAKKGLDKAPAFSCLLYYHRLNAGSLTTLKSQYVSPLRQSYETELRTLDGLVLLSAEQSARRVQLEAWIDELRKFEDRLERCAREGFASPVLTQVTAKEPLDRWVSRDGQAEAPASRAEFEAQEMRYDPDLNDGVRVNIAPLQKYGLLAADVLDAKDIEKAIADRADWRADERRWCREGKLPRPGWWK